MSNKNNAQNNANHANNTNNNGAEVRAENHAPAEAVLDVKITETEVKEERMPLDEKALEAIRGSKRTEEIKLGWGDIAVGASLGGFATFARRAATKLMVEGYNETTGETIEADSWGAIAAHTAVSAAVTGAVVGICQKTVMKNMHPVRQGGIVIVTSQAVNLIDALVGDMAAKAIIGGKAKLSDMINGETEVVAEA